LQHLAEITQSLSRTRVSRLSGMAREVHLLPDGLFVFISAVELIRLVPGLRVATAMWWLPLGSPGDVCYSTYNGIRGERALAM